MNLCHRLCILLTVLTLIGTGCTTSANETSAEAETVEAAETAGTAETENEPSSATTTAETTAPPTTAATTATTAEELDAGAISNSKTFDIYRSRVPVEQAIHCLLASEVEQGERSRAVPREWATGDLFDLYVQASESGNEADEAAYRTAVLEVDAAEFEPRFVKIRAGVAILDATTDVTSAKATFTATLDEVEVIIADIQAGAATVDVAPYMRIGFDETFASYEIDNACPFTGATDSPIAQAMSNFGGDNERFGGRGTDAQSRCHIAMAIEIALEATAAGEPLQDIVTGGFTMMGTQWFDRDPDQAAVAAADRWVAGLDNGDDPAALAAATLDEWLTYRAATPEGFILCPLDRGWEA